MGLRDELVTEDAEFAGFPAEIGWFGDKSENGGWEPHVHFQLSLERPESCDMPGVVNPEDRDSALMKYPDPRLVLGQIY